ncbi:hypothetical protein N7481_001232 [Penicillium waksmanii]|uniref:uncharacterized protein n=1 Tax=Penicillium waksmanii TaxID=69791 RepID=UPI002546BF33|nr:uncharacterized protein N7481_001232 [Penicillium waksmanii]KAJ6000823.1 hypothetical protein N7481_001232 [Penicillium waksmanii]
MGNYGVGQIWEHTKSIFARKRYQGVSHIGQGQNDDQVELVNAPSLRSQPSAFSLSSSLTSFSDFARQSTFASKSSIKKRPSNEDVTFLEIGSGAAGDEQSSHRKGDQKLEDRKAQWIDGVYMCAKAGTIVFLLNLIFIAVAAGLASRFPENPAFGSSAVIYRGSCGVCKRWDTALHLIINVLSTCILAASNYCMQTLVAPTREEVDAHHAEWKWLDIGSASVNNLFAIEKSRLGLWLVLLFTATPFHLMYNSMVFESLSTNQFGVVVGPKDLNSSNVHELTTPALADPTIASSTFTSQMRWPTFIEEIANENYDRISVSECSAKVKTTATGIRGIVALASNLTVSLGGDSAILMTLVDNTDIQTSATYFHGDNLEANLYANQTVYKGSNATCLAYNDVRSTFYDETTGEVMQNYFGTTVMPIEECLVIRAEEHCQLLYSPPICLTIMLAAFAKIAAMFLAAHIGRSRSPPLLTVGDAVASFMEKPDPTTKGLCWIAGADVRRGGWAKVTKAGFQAVLQNEQSDPIAYRRLKKRSFWGRAASGWRWLATLFMCFLCIIVGSLLFSLSLSAGMYGGTKWISANTFKNWFSSDVDMSDDNIIGGNSMGLTMLASVVIANTPQLAITISYYCYNAVLTSMLAAGEYSSYGASSKALRVTWPVKGSQQRSTYWLSIPYKYGVPILVLYMTLHWLVSQSIFYLLLITYDPANEPVPGLEISSLGYSSSPIFLSIIVGSIMVLVLIVLAFRKFKSTVPVTGSTSVAISAACHLPRDEVGETAVLGLVKWGETTMSPDWAMGSFGGIDDGQKGHCSFTSLETKKPTLMKLYA